MTSSRHASAAGTPRAPDRPATPGEQTGKRNSDERNDPQSEQGAHEGDAYRRERRADPDAAVNPGAREHPEG